MEIIAISDGTILYCLCVEDAKSIASEVLIESIPDFTDRHGSEDASSNSQRQPLITPQKGENLLTRMRHSIYSAAQISLDLGIRRNGA